MIQRRDQAYILATLGATASVLGCLAVSLATMSHAQIPTPRFYAQNVPARMTQAVKAGEYSSVVISR